MGEKYDGIRCCWNPTNHILYLYNFSILMFIFASTKFEKRDIQEEDMSCHFFYVLQPPSLINLLTVSCGTHYLFSSLQLSLSPSFRLAL